MLLAVLGTWLRANAVLAVAVLLLVAALVRAWSWATSRLSVGDGALLLTSGRLHRHEERVAAGDVASVALAPEGAWSVVRGRGTLVVHHRGGRAAFGPVRHPRQARLAVVRALGASG